uniref:Uncharacterized protein n=1 Tax=Setaria viridis TaxID=4556 RepID=A0A4U6W6T5_SETVI|nr:hypothetical protein SEVIR_1G038866v2 [Setaria viridis]
MWVRRLLLPHANWQPLPPRSAPLPRNKTSRHLCCSCCCIAVAVTSSNREARRLSTHRRRPAITEARS